MSKAEQSASDLIDQKIADLDDWRGQALATMRKLIKAADPQVAKGAALKDPAKVFNSSLDGNTRRAIDIAEGEVVDADAFKALIRSAVAHNKGATKAKSAANA